MTAPLLRAIRRGAGELADDPGFREFRGASVLVTGASGMIGSWIALAFLEADRRQGLGLSVHGLSRDMSRAAELYSGLPLVPVSRNVAAAMDDLPRFDCVVHAASPVGPAVFAERPFDVVAANLAGTVRLLEKAARDRARRFLFVSTHETYGTGREIWREDEAGALDFMSPRACYPESKRAGENACVCCARQYGLRTGIVRLARIYGPGMNLDSGLFVCDFLKDALAGRKVAVKGDGALIRPLLHVRDAVRGILTALFAGEAGRAYNAAPAGAETIADIARLVAGLAETEAVVPAPGPGGGAVQDASRLRALGWRETVPLRDGLADLLRCYR